jgi:2-polyprenyl-3-methyl-5-hydroxy-6-metoxy-1,4-benzoquinol methylase
MTKFDKQYYEEQAKQIPKEVTLYKLGISRYRWLIEHLLRIYKNPTAVNILDIGIQDGQFATGTAAFDFNVIGVDIADEYVRIAKLLRKNVLPEDKNISFQQADICDCEEFVAGKKDFFDCAYSFEVLEHVPDLPKALQNIHTMLKENGLLFICVPNENSWAHDESHIRKFSAYNKEGHIHLYRGLEIERFEVCKIEVAQYDEANSWLYASLQKLK